VDDVWDGLMEIMKQPTHFTLQVPKGTPEEAQKKILKKLKYTLYHILILKVMFLVKSYI
jgi:hypothetical protein